MTEPCNCHNHPRNALDDPVPGGVYLCQVGDEISCGACCGLYNIADLTRKNMTRMLAARSERFARTERTVSAMESFARQTAHIEPRQRPFSELHHCPYIGLIGEPPGRVGCLLHPLADGNHGVDFRGLSYYGGMACRTYFCPSVRNLPARWLTAVRQSMRHWYLHGLIVTERGLLTGFFSELELRLGRPVDSGDFSSQPTAKALRDAFTALKLQWPFRRPDAVHVGNYFFEDGLYQRSPVERENTSIPQSRCEKIFQELDSRFRSTADLRDAEKWLFTNIDRLAAMLTR